MKNVFDIRTIIAVLFGIYGVVLVVMGLVAPPEETDQAEGFNINLWSGAAMVIFAVLFAAWVLWRPIRMPSESDEETGNRQS